jgi:hypothetical protein
MIISAKELMLLSEGYKSIDHLTKLVYLDEKCNQPGMASKISRASLFNMKGIFIDQVLHRFHGRLLLSPVDLELKLCLVSVGAFA